MHQFRENELTVKTKDNNLIISASHEEREDPQGFISRQFTRRYVIPDDVKLDQLGSINTIFNSASQLSYIIFFNIQYATYLLTGS